MAFKLKTSQQTEEIFNRIEASERLPWPTLMRLALSLSIRQGSLMELELYLDNMGRELNRQTITGDADTLYKCLIELQEGRHISDEEYFPTYVKAHLDRGARLLEQEKKYSRDLLVHLTELNKSI
ncbi:MAG: DUF1832 domain-containing protein [Ruminococcaceae bacterium]|nr:DUF1832 domain-containing protein [Oscillospiraceae bacterium]